MLNQAPQSRRSFLRGIGLSGAAISVGLPAFESQFNARANDRHGGHDMLDRRHQHGQIRERLDGGEVDAIERVVIGQGPHRHQVPVAVGANPAAIASGLLLAVAAAQLRRSGHMLWIGQCHVPGPAPLMLGDDALRSVRRIEAMWEGCRRRFGDEGDFLFGRFCAADAMYAPVVSRLHTYAVDVSGPARAYMDSIMALPAWREWEEAALKETWVLAEDEIDWPETPRRPEAVPVCG